MKAEIWNLESEFCNMKAKIWHPKSGSLKSAIWNPEYEILNLKADTRNLKSEIWKLKSQNRTLKSKSRKQKSEIQKPEWVQYEAAEQGRGRRISETCNLKPGIQSQESNNKNIETGI